jgi:hypothetical protein
MIQGVRSIPGIVFGVSERVPCYYGGELNKLLEQKMNAFVLEKVKALEGQTDQWKTPTGLVLDLRFYNEKISNELVSILNQVSQNHNKDWLKSEVRFPLKILMANRSSFDWLVPKSC